MLIISIICFNLYEIYTNIVVSYSYLIIKDGVPSRGVILQLLVGEGHPLVVVVGAAHQELAGVLVQRKLVEPHRAHEGYMGGLNKKCCLNSKAH